MQFCPFPILAILFHFWCHFANAAESECYSCASPILQSEWQSTGLPIHPALSQVDTPAGTSTKNFAFTNTCDKKFDASNNIMPKTACAGGACIEMLILANGIYSAVRGCSSDFYTASKQPSYGKPECMLNMLNQNTTIWDVNKPVPVQQTYVGYRTCITALDTPCNGQLEAISKFAQGIFKKTDDASEIGWDLKCEKVGGGVQCLSCARYDMEGTCNWDVRKYCDGRWCTKTIGYVNGRWLEVRGCSPINPSNTQTCVKIERDTQLSLLADVAIPRSLSIEHCFCMGQRCNGAMKMAGTSIPTELLLILAISIIAFSRQFQ